MGGRLKNLHESQRGRAKKEWPPGSQESLVEGIPKADHDAIVHPVRDRGRFEGWTTP
jgi:hypothetical protein